MITRLQPSWRCSAWRSAHLATITCASKLAPAALFSVGCDGLVAVLTVSQQTLILVLIGQGMVQLPRPDPPRSSAASLHPAAKCSDRSSGTVHYAETSLFPIK